jgi:hypothetical protein
MGNVGPHGGEVGGLVGGAGIRVVVDAHEVDVRKGPTDTLRRSPSAAEKDKDGH